MSELDLSRIAPLTDAEAARLVSPATFDDLASRITATPLPATRRRRLTGAAGMSPLPFGPFPGRPRRRLALLTALPVALAAVTGVLIAMAGQGDTGPGSSAAFEAMSFTRENGTITVVIKNLYADTSWYNADLARHHLDITLHLVAASPSLVGFINAASFDPDAVRHSGEIKPISAPGSCARGGADCQIGFTVPAGFRGRIRMWIGRPARPGEQYQMAGSAFNAGESLHGLADQVIGRTVSEVLPVLARHGVTVAQCRDQGPGMWGNGVCDPSAIPGDWHVVDVSPWAADQVMVTIQTEP